MPETHATSGPPAGARPGASTDRDGDDLVLVLRGDLDAVTWEEPAVVLAAALATDGSHPHARRVVVDLAEVPFADSCGLGCLVRLRTLARDHDVALALRGPRPQLTRLLRVCGLDGVFDVLPVSGP